MHTETVQIDEVALRTFEAEVRARGFINESDYWRTVGKAYLSKGHTVEQRFAEWRRGKGGKAELEELMKAETSAS